MRKDIIVGIDFGTAGIGYAFSTENQPNSIIQADLEGQNQSRKVPNEIILSSDLKFILAFGAQCKQYIINNDNSDYEYFKNIKMNLYKKIYKIKSQRGKEVDIDIVISKILEEISAKALTQIKRVMNYSVKKEDIKWVLTVPAIWEEKSKQIMIKASLNAGLIDENTDKSLFLALEPEAASIYYLEILLQQKKFHNPHIEQGSPYIICDIGAGTVDICTHRKIKQNDNSFIIYEEYPPIGGDFGGKKINEEFINRLIIPLFGKEKVNELKNSHDNYDEWITFENNIEMLKKSLSDNLNDILYLDCRLFESEKKNLNDYISEYYKNNLYYKYKIQNKNKNSAKNKWILQFDSQIFHDIMMELARKIFTKIEEIYNDVHTNYIIFSGAGAENHILTNYIIKCSNQKNIKLTTNITINPEVAIINGAVLFGFQRDIIRKRKAKFTLGIQVNEKWATKYQEKGVKTFLQCANDYFCTNLFSKYITINQYIDYDNIITHNYNALDKRTNISFYKTFKDNCIYTDEKDESGNLVIHKFGETTFDIGEDYDINQKSMTIKMNLGGTYIDVCAIYDKTGRSIHITKSFI